MRIWFKQWKDSRMVRDLVIEDNSDETRTHKVFGALDQACYDMDLGRPLWLDVTRQAKARFTKDCFMEEVPFDYLEIDVIEED